VSAIVWRLKIGSWMRVRDRAFLDVCAIRDIGVGGHIPGIGGVLEASEDRFHQLTQVAEGEVAPDRTPKFLVPINDGVGQRERIGSAEKILTIENAVAV